MRKLGQAMWHCGFMYALNFWAHGVPSVLASHVPLFAQDVASSQKYAWSIPAPSDEDIAGDAELVVVVPSHDGYECFGFCSKKWPITFANGVSIATAEASFSFFHVRLFSC